MQCFTGHRLILVHLLLVQAADGQGWLEKKYESLSEVVPFTNRFRFGDTTASYTMHAALWNGSAWDLELSSRLALNATLDLLVGSARKAALADSAGEVRVLDAGSGWGGSVFLCETMIRERLDRSSQPGASSVLYDGMTLSPTQARASNAAAVSGYTTPQQ